MRGFFSYQKNSSQQFDEFFSFLLRTILHILRSQKHRSADFPDPVCKKREEINSPNCCKLFFLQKETNSSQQFDEFFSFLLRTIWLIIQLISLSLYAKKEKRKTCQTVVNCIFYKKKQIAHNSLTSFSLFFCVQFCTFCVRKSIVQLISLILVYRSVARLALAFTTVHTSSHDPLTFQSSHQVSYVTFFFL